MHILLKTAADLSTVIKFGREFQIATPFTKNEFPYLTVRCLGRRNFLDRELLSGISFLCKYNGFWHSSSLKIDKQHLNLAKFSNRHPIRRACKCDTDETDLNGKQILRRR